MKKLLFITIIVVAMTSLAQARKICEFPQNPNPPLRAIERGNVRITFDYTDKPMVYQVEIVNMTVGQLVQVKILKKDEFGCFPIVDIEFESGSRENLYSSKFSNKKIEKGELSINKDDELRIIVLVGGAAYYYPSEDENSTFTIEGLRADRNVADNK